MHLNALLQIAFFTYVGPLILQPMIIELLVIEAGVMAALKEYFIICVCSIRVIEQGSLYNEWAFNYPILSIYYLNTCT